MTPVQRVPPVGLRECADCHAPIVWCELDTGSRIPLNPRPVIDPRRGNVLAIIVGTGRRATLYGHVESHARPWRPGDLRMTPHVATCEVVREKREQTARAQQHPALFDLPTEETHP